MVLLMNRMFVSTGAPMSKSTAMTVWIVVSLSACFIGFFLPAYYDWSGADQSRPSPWIPFAFAVLGVGVALSCVVLGLRHFYWRIPSAAAIKDGWYPLVFAVGVVGVLSALQASAIQNSGLRKLVLILSFIAWGIVVVWGCYQAYQHARLRWALAALLVSCYGPFLWIVVGKYSQYTSLQAVPFLVGAPLLVPTGFLGMVIGVNLQELMWLANGLTTIAIAVGLAFMHLGEKRALGYTLLLLVISAAGSMAFHSLMRA
jgi:hypothetical protein